MVIYQREEILEDHKLWLKTDGKKGERANFWKAALDHLTLSKADLRGVDCSNYSRGRKEFFYVAGSEREIW